MRIYLLRHGNAESGKNDFNRALSLKGVNQIKQHRDTVRQVENLTIWSSDSKRTTESYQHLNISNPAIFKNELYLASLDELLLLLTENPIETNLFLIGHNPGISSLASYLLDERIHFSTGELMKIDLGELKVNEISQGVGMRIF